MSTPQIKENSIHNQRKLQKRLLRKEIGSVLRKLTLTHLFSDSITNLFELSKEEVKEKYLELKLNKDKNVIADLLVHRSQDFSVKELENICYSLQLYQCVFHRTRKNWTAVSLLDPKEDFQSNSNVNDITRNIMQAYRIKGLNAVVKVTSHEDLIWVMIREKRLTKRNGIRLQNPIFFCFEVDTHFMFAIPPIKDKDMNCILKALQYQRQKAHHLEGKDVKSLLALLKLKHKHPQNQVPVVIPTVSPEKGHRYIDLSMGNSRKLYAEKVFETQVPINLETFTVNADAVWRDTSIVPSMEGEPFKVSAKLKSKNLFEMMKYAVAKDMVALPVPNYLSSILRSGKNKIDMRIPQAKK